MAGGPNNFTDVEPDNVYQDRVAVDGLNLYDFKDKLKPFMNPEKVYDKQDRSYFKGIKIINKNKYLLTR